VILYEYPLNERTRTYLRLEHLFVRLTALSARETALDHHYAIATLFEIMDISGRVDLKSDVLKDLDRQKHQLGAYRGNPTIAERVLNDTMHQLDACFRSLNQLIGKVGQALSENDWLMSIRSRMGIPGGTCAFDLPAYFAWQHQPAPQRQADLTVWRASLEPLHQSIQLLLKLLRDSGTSQQVVASNGQFQQNMPTGRPFQLLRLSPKDTALVPEISGNRLLISIRLMHQSADAKLQPASGNAALILTLCA
jgi:cell division protein ZapD